MRAVEGDGGCGAGGAGVGDGADAVAEGIVEAGS